LKAPVQQEQLPFDALATTASPEVNTARRDGLVLRENRRSANQFPQQTASPVRGDSSFIWDGEHQAFVPGTLRRAMLVRGFTPDTLRVAAGVAHGTMYNALAGRATRLRTARRILETLAAVEPAFLLADMA
jgi:hypothetical protein